MSLESDLEGLTVSALDIHSGYLVVEQGATVHSAVERMRDEKTHCALITAGGSLVGIFTDYDVIKKVLGHPESWERSVEELMTPAPRTVGPQTPALKALTMMGEEQFRNLPVVNGNGEVLGNVGQQSILRFLSDRYHMHVYNQPPEPGRYARARHGA